MLHNITIAKALPKDERGRVWSLHSLQTVDSTNNYALQLLKAGERPPFVVIAEAQTKARGRLGKTWVSPYADNLYYSLAVNLTAQALYGLSLTISLAIVDALLSFGVTDSTVKWPNDVYFSGRKLAGILIERINKGIVIGIGINVNMKSMQLINQPWISLHEIIGYGIDRNQLCIRLSASLAKKINEQQDSGFSAFKEAWQARHLYEGKYVGLYNHGKTIASGVVLGVNQRGALMLNVDGVVKAFDVGEISLRPLDDIGPRLR